MFQGLDHLAIVVQDTEEALKIWRGKFGLPLILQEKVNNGTILLTHLDLGNTDLQLVQPLSMDHPLQKWLDNNGPGLHHFCLSVSDVQDAIENMEQKGLTAGEPRPHQGTQGKRALFIDSQSTGGVQVEITGA